MSIDSITSSVVGVVADPTVADTSVILMENVMQGAITSAIGIFIVFTALAALALIIAALPTILTVVNKFIPEGSGHGHGHGGSVAKKKPASDDSAIAVAIAAAFHKDNSGK